MAYELNLATRNFLQDYAQLPVDSYPLLNRAVALTLYDKATRKLRWTKLSAAHGSWLRKQVKASLRPRFPEIMAHGTASLSVVISTGVIVASLLEKPQSEASEEVKKLYSLLAQYEISLP